MTLRLWLLAGVALVIAGLVATVFYYRGSAISARAATAQVEAERDQLQRDLGLVVTVNSENLAEMERMKAEDERKQRIIVGMADEIADINIELLNKTEAYQALKEADADVSKYLSQPIPDALRRLRDQQAPAAGNRQK